MKEKDICKIIRKDIAKYGYLSGRGHISSALSMVEILVALYIRAFFNVESIANNEPNRDRFVLSKGHGALALYVTLTKAGIISEDALEGFATNKGIVSTHPVANSLRGVEMTAGSLGQGICFANGLALSSKMQGFDNKIVVLVGDGELQEGSNWEAMLFASHNKLDNLTILVDANKMQISGFVENIVSLNSLKDKLTAFGFDTIKVDGHNVDAIYGALCKGSYGKPRAIIADTTKGKGLSFIENQNGWHGKGLNEEQYNLALKELD